MSEIPHQERGAAEAGQEDVVLAVAGELLVARTHQGHPDTEAVVTAAEIAEKATYEQDTVVRILKRLELDQRVSLRTDGDQAPVVTGVRV